MFQEMELSGPKIKNFLTFSQKYFFYISGSENLSISAGSFLSSKSKKTFLCFRKQNFLAPAFRFLIFFPEKIHSEKISHIS